MITELSLKSPCSGEIRIDFNDITLEPKYAEDPCVVSFENEKIQDDEIKILISNNVLKIISGRILSFNCYVFMDEDKVIISTSLNSLIKRMKEYHYEIKIDQERLNHYIYGIDQFSEKQDFSFIKGVKKVLPGSSMIIGTGECESKIYWNLASIKKNDKKMGKEELAKSLKKLLQKELNRFSNQSSVLLLSEGMDSALIGALALQQNKPEVICSDFGNKSDNERKELFAREYSLSCIHMSVSNIFFKISPSILEGDFFPSDSLFISEIQSRYKSYFGNHTHVYFGGYGADEVFTPEKQIHSDEEELIFNYMKNTEVSNENELIFFPLNSIKLDPFRSSEIIDFVVQNKLAIKESFGTGKKLLRYILRDLTSPKIFKSRISDSDDYVEKLEIENMNKEIYALLSKYRDTKVNKSIVDNLLYDTSIEDFLQKKEHFVDYDCALIALRYILSKIWVSNLIKKIGV